MVSKSFEKVRAKRLRRLRRQGREAEGASKKARTKGGLRRLQSIRTKGGFGFEGEDEGGFEGFEGEDEASKASKGFEGTWSFFLKWTPLYYISSTVGRSCGSLN